MSAQLITPLPTPPSRTNPVDFNNRAEAFHGALRRMVEEINQATPGDSAAGLAQYLAQTEEGMGAGLIGFNPTLNYLAAQLGRHIADHSVSPRDFPWLAKFDGVTDDRPAIQACLNWSQDKAQVVCPAGTAMLGDELRQPSRTYLAGQGLDITFFKLMNSAPASANVITNASNDRTTANGGSSNIVIRDLTVDGNYQRLGGVFPSIASTGGCGVGLANVRGALVSRVRATNCVKHGIDIASSAYSTAGPTVYAAGPSSNIRIEYCEVDAFGDDGITTHYSRDIEIVGCYCHDSGNFYTVGNSNGIEIDDGSADVRVIGGRVERCVRGIQIKAHLHSPAAANVRVYGLTAEACTQNFALRHEGFDGSGDPKSLSAFGIELIGCTSIIPRQKGASTLSRRALNISGYDGVMVRDFMVIGTADLTPASDPTYTTDASTTSTIAIFGNARNVVIDGMTFKGVREATETLIQVNSTASHVKLSRIRAWECSGKVIDIAASTVGVEIDGVLAETTVTPAPSHVIETTNSVHGGTYTIRGVRQSGYTNAYRLLGVDHPEAFDIGPDRTTTYRRQVEVNRDSTAAHFVGLRANVRRWVLGASTASAYFVGQQGANLQFRTDAGDSDTGTLRVQIDSATGAVTPGADNAQAHGAPSLRWTQYHAGTGTISTSDAREKTDIGEIPDAVLDAWADVQWCQYRFTGRVRLHAGLISQQVARAFNVHGLDAREWGVLCWDEWPEQPEIRETVCDKDEEGRPIPGTEREIVVQQHRPAGERYGIRYDEAQALEAALMRRTTKRLEQQLAALNAAHGAT